MPRAAYHREQAAVLLRLALTTSDAELAAQLETKARVHLNLANVAKDPILDIALLLDGYNDAQMRKPRA